MAIGIAELVGYGEDYVPCNSACGTARVEQRADHWPLLVNNGQAHARLRYLIGPQSSGSSFGSSTRAANKLSATMTHERDHQVHNLPIRGYAQEAWRTAAHMHLDPESRVCVLHEVTCQREGQDGTRGTTRSLQHKQHVFSRAHCAGDQVALK